MAAAFTDQLPSAAEVTHWRRDVSSARARSHCVIRRIVDLIAASLLLVLLFPVLAVIAMAVRLTSPGPAFFNQRRIGRHGERFTVMKFRTMVPGAEAQRAAVLGGPDGDMSLRQRNDPRITPIGRLLRRWSLDELPQLINVVRGDMALVGPRPILPDELELLEPHHHARHSCRPGLTGLWQISGRKDTSWADRMALDLQYVDSQSLPTDLRILGRTVGAVIAGQGAY